MKNLTNNRINWIDGLKALSAFQLCIMHFLAAFFSQSYVGMNTSIPKSDAKQAILNNLPISLFTNSSFGLYIFFALIAFIPAYKYFSSKDLTFIKKQAQNRYFRLVIPVALTTFIFYIFWKFKMGINIETNLIIKSSWIVSQTQLSPDFFEALYSAFIKTFIFGDKTFCIILWCINIIFIGSYLSYAIILLLKHFPKRFIIYTIFAIALSFFPYYMSFLTGIIAADIYTHKKLKNLTFLIIIGLIIGLIPRPLIPFGIDRAISYALGSFLVIIGCCSSKKIQTFLSKTFFINWGKLSFSLMLSHLLVIFGLSFRIFFFLYWLNIPFNINILLTFILSIPIAATFSKIFQKLTDATFFYLKKLFNN